MLKRLPQAAQQPSSGLYSTRKWQSLQAVSDAMASKAKESISSLIPDMLPQLTNAPMGFNRFKYLTNDWQMISFHSLTEEQIRANPPPIVGR